MVSYKLNLTNETKDECGFTLIENEISCFYDDTLVNDFGSVKYCEITLDNLNKLKNEYQDNFLDVFCEIFNTEYEEAKAISSNINEANVNYLYIQTIDLDYKRGTGIGCKIVDMLKEKYHDHKIILFPYPIPIRWQLGFDFKYMEEAKEKIVTFYKNCGFEYNSENNVASLENLGCFSTQV